MINLKSFQQFLNEFEIEGEHHIGKKYNGDIGQIFFQFEKDMISQFGEINTIDGEMRSNHGYKSSEFGKGDDSIFCSYIINDAHKHQLTASISHLYIEDGLKEIKNKLKKINLEGYITASTIEGEHPDEYYYTTLEIPIGLIS